MESMDVVDTVWREEMLSILAWTIIVVVVIGVVGTVAMVAISDPEMFWGLVFPFIAIVVGTMVFSWAVVYLANRGG